MAAKRPNNTIRLVTTSLTKRQLRALTVFAAYDITMPRLANQAGIVPVSAIGDLECALCVVHRACYDLCTRHGVKTPATF